MEKKNISKSGIALYEYKNPASHGFHLSLFIKAGSMYEAENEKGITHFFEHTAIRNINAVMNGNLYSELDRLGVEFNASTYAEMVQFYLSGASDKLNFARDVILKIFSPVILSSSEIEAERRRIKAEIRESEDRTSIITLATEAVNRGTSLARLITGTVGDVNKITKSRLEEYRVKILSKNNCFFYLTGNYTEEDKIKFLLALDEIFLPEAEEIRRNIAPVSENHFKRDGTPIIKNADFSMLRFTFDLDMQKLTVPETDLIYDMLLSGYSSRLFIEMSEREGLFYDVSGAVERYRNIGEFCFSFEVRTKDVYRAAELAVGILKSYKEKLLPPDALMKSSYVDNAYLLLDDVRDLNFTMAYDNHIMELGYASLAERSAAYEKITPEDIRRAACEIFKPENLTLAIKGNKKSINSERIKAIISSL